MDDAPTRVLESAIADAAAPLLVVAEGGPVLAANEAFRATFGAPPDDLDGLRLLSAEPVSDDASSVDLPALLREAKPASGIALLRTINGEPVRTGYSVTPLGEGAPYHGAILALQPLEAPSLTPEPAFTALAESAPCIAWVASVDGAVLFRNREWDAGGPVGPTSAPLTALHPDDIERCRGLWESALREGVMYEAVARHRVDDTYREFLTRAAPLTNEIGEVVAWFGTTTDLEPVNAVERSSGERGDGEGGGDRESKTVLAVASHELRAPLAVLRGMAQITRRRSEQQQLSDRELREALAMIEGQADRTLLLVEQLLDHARLGVGKLELQRGKCDVTNLVRGVVDRVNAAHEGRVIEVRAAGPVTASVDAPRIEQVLMNLLDNAIKFSPADSRIDVRVVRVVSGEDEVAEIAVRDRGRGIPVSERSLIFERFHQVTSDDASKGMGLGLAICKEIVELHGGTLSVGTPRGGGARFVVRLPVTQPAELQRPHGASR
ncbi:MAG: hypothetical protein IT299_07490 [Dehalococcoidia bacterium]|nr:hypothetical protein [Dehalococcoidia bacterium]